MHKKESRAAFCLFLTSLIWGFAFVAQVRGLEFMGSLTFGGVRFAMGALSLLPVILLFERHSGGRAKTRQTLLYGALGGVALFIASTLQQYGIQYTGSAGKAGFITGLYIVLVPLFGIALGRKPPWLTWVAALFACAGRFFLSLPKESSIADGFGGFGRGEAMLLIGAVFWALHILLVDHLAIRVTPIRFSAVQFAVCAVLSLAAAFLFETPSWAGIRAGAVPLLYGGLLSVGVAYTMQIVGQRHVEPARAAIIFSLESLFAALGGVLLLREAMGWKGWLGGALMFVGILLAQSAPRKREKSPLQETGT
ncbi:MAG: DMT family transporter [Oscillospiraceae bacterium]|nr:DMT family transporter [Oscillospiraceae bacterium]